MKKNITERLLSKELTLAIVGLGYVGLPIALAFAKKGVQVIGFDVNQLKISRLREGRDDTGETTSEDFIQARSNIVFTSHAEDLKKASFIIVAVPTPIDCNRTPDLSPLTKASELIGRHLTEGTTVIFESTVYPGVTEEHCVPIIARESGLSPSQFFVGYSPERINPGDKEHTLAKVVKVVSGQNQEVCDEIACVYELIVEAGVYKAESIKVAEAAKVIENTQRDLNIALMNELSIIFERVGIDTEAVLKAAGTKWNFLKFHPGLVGGHCIGVDPYYLTSKAEQLGYHPQVVLAGRRINDSMGTYVAQQTVKQMIKAGKVVEGAKILILGLTFKENVPDFRNSRVVDIIRELRTYGVQIYAYDPFADGYSPEEEGVKLIQLSEAKDMDALILAVSHDELKKKSPKELRGFCKAQNGKPVLVDVRWAYRQKEAEEAGFSYWRL